MLFTVCLIHFYSLPVAVPRSDLLTSAATLFGGGDLQQFVRCERRIPVLNLRANGGDLLGLYRREFVSPIFVPAHIGKNSSNFLVAELILPRDHRPVERFSVDVD